MQKDPFKENRLFLAGWLLITLIFGGFLLNYEKVEAFIMLNPWHTPFLDMLFRIVTILGDGWFIIAVVVLLFFIRCRPLAILALSSYALSGLIVQILKPFFAAERPRLYFENRFIHYQYFLDQITLHSSNSFPSGHTASAFALAAALTFTIRKTWVSLLILLAAVLTGYSRIYLGQHFPEDVITGAAIGVFSTIVCVAIMDKLNKRRQTSA